MRIIDRLSLLWRRFAPFEQHLLAAVRTVLPEAARSIFDAQVAAIGLVQRDPRWTEIRFYRRRGVNWDGVPMFPCTDEFAVAQVSFSARGKRYKAKLSCIKGRIFDFIVSPNPKQIAFADWDGEPAAKLLRDPMGQTTGRSALERLPLEWRQFLKQHSGQDMSGWVLYDEHTAYRVPSQDGESLLLAEREGDEFILQNLEEGPDNGKLMYLGSHDGVPEQIHGALEDVLKQGIKKHGT